MIGGGDSGGSDSVVPVVRDGGCLQLQSCGGGGHSGRVVASFGLVIVDDSSPPLSLMHVRLKHVDRIYILYNSLIILQKTQKKRTQ